jgi:uncharacterized UPF0146 family protein
MTKPNFTYDEKISLLTRAFETEEGTRAVYKAAKLEVPARLAPTMVERVIDFRRAIGAPVWIN